MAPLPPLVVDSVRFGVLTGHNDSDTARVTALIAQASKRVRKHCRWHIYPSLANDSLTVDGSGTAVLDLPTLYVASVASVVENGVTLVAGTNYEWADYGCLFRIDGQEWTKKKRGVVVTLTHGFDTLPEDVEGVVAEMVSAALEASFGTTSDSGEGISAVYLGNGISISAAQRQALGDYTIRTL